MTLYYVGPDVRITHQVFESLRPVRQRFLIHELRYVHLVQPAPARALVRAWAARRQPIELRATYRGSLICLYRTSDRRMLGQVSRALTRVLERAATVALLSPGSSVQRGPHRPAPRQRAG